MYNQRVFDTLFMYFPEMLAVATHMTDAELLSLYSDMLESGYV